jgi:hypothetical protein
MLRIQTETYNLLECEKEVLALPSRTHNLWSSRMDSIQDEIDALFSWNPPPLKPDADKKLSASTRPPAFYDKHFFDQLVLCQVKRLPSLVPDLAANVDCALVAASKTLPPVDRFITARKRERDIWYLNPVVRDEKGVADFYHQTTARFCAHIASTLALHPKVSTSEWRGLLEWTQSVSSSGYAIVDGELQIFPARFNDTRREMIVGTMESETHCILRRSGTPACLLPLGRLRIHLQVLIR